ncbi:MAG TPA: N-acetylmuramoyl-L-alanine amidase [Actinomycetales bacterium]
MTQRAHVRPGDQGLQVRAVVERLIATGDLPSHADTGSDLYDGPVETAVRAFQQRRGMLADGVVGPQTYRALDGARWQLGDRILLHVPGHLLMGDDVAALQQRLLELGFSSGRVDSLFGPLTDDALRQLQRGVGLRPDGVAGPQTLRALSQLSRSVGGGAPEALREADRVRTAGPSLAGRVVVLDPGHGATSPGATSGDLVEADLVLDLARRIEGRLAVVGVQVVLTRGLTGDPDDVARAELANEIGADLLLSLHCESMPTSERANGVATYFYGRDDHGGAWSVTGERLATLVQSEIVSRTDLLDCRTHPRSWDLLRRTQMPAVRVDVGHLSNDGDARRLADPAFRDTLAEAVVVAIQRVYLPAQQDAATGTLRIADVMAQAQRS